MDSLDLLRRAFQSGGGGATRDEATGDIVLGATGTRVSGKTPTRLVSGKDKSWYTLETLWFGFMRREDDGAAYVRACKSAGIPHLYFPDRRSVTQYLAGEVATVANLRPLSELLPQLREQQAREEEARRVAEAQRSAAAAAAAAAVTPEQAAARLARKERKAACRAQMAERLRALRASMVLGAVSNSDISSGAGVDANGNSNNDNGNGGEGGTDAGVVGVDADKLADLQLQKLCKRQRLDDTLPEPAPDAGLYHEYLELDRAAADAIARAEHDLVPRTAVLDAAFGKTLEGIDPELARLPPVAVEGSAAGVHNSASGHYHERQQHSSSSGGGGGSEGVPGGMPLIIVPSALTSPITLANVRAFLERGVWTDPQKHPARSSGHVEVTHEMRTADAVVATHSTKTVFCVIDNASKLKPADWFVFPFFSCTFFFLFFMVGEYRDRVVAAFITGAAWQFRDWKWKAANEALSNMAGFYVKFDAEPVPPVIGSWNATVLKVC